MAIDCTLTLNKLILFWAQKNYGERESLDLMFLFVSLKEGEEIWRENQNRAHKEVFLKYWLIKNWNKIKTVWCSVSSHKRGIRQKSEIICLNIKSVFLESRKPFVSCAVLIFWTIMKLQTLKSKRVIMSTWDRRLYFKHIFEIWNV